MVLDSAAATGQPWLAWTMGKDLCDVADSFRPSLPEHHPRTHVQELWVLDETELACGLVPRPQVVSVHRQDGGCLPCTATVHWGEGGGGRRRRRGELVDRRVMAFCSLFSELTHGLVLW